MARSRYKFKHINFFNWKNILRHVKFTRWKDFKHHYIYSKNTIILPCYQDMLVKVHKGHQFKKLIISSRMIGKKFGSFVLTRKPFFFPLKVKKKK